MYVFLFNSYNDSRLFKERGVGMKRTKLDYIEYIGGILLLTLGVALSSKAGLGTGSLDSINFALVERTGLNLPFIIVGMAGVAILISALIRRQKPRLKSLIAAFLMAVFTEGWVNVVEKISIQSFLMQLFVFFIALICIAFGLAIYLKPKLPANPNDDITVSLHEVYHLRIGTAKLVVDLTAIGIALLLNGPIGVGTLLLTVLLGPLVNKINAIFFNPRTLSMNREMKMSNVNESLS